MSGIEMWEQYGFGFWDILGAMWLDILAGLCALGWAGFWLTIGWGSFNRDDLQTMGWKWMLGHLVLWLTMLLPLVRLVWMIVEIWFLK